MNLIILRVFIFVTFFSIFRVSYGQELENDALSSLFEEMWLAKRKNPAKVDSIFFVAEANFNLKHQIKSKIYLRNHYARIKLYQGNAVLARKLVDSNLVFSKKMNDSMLIASCYREIGGIYQTNLAMDSGLYYLSLAIKMAQPNSITFLDAYRIKSLIYMRQGRYEKALQITTSIINTIPNNTKNFEYYTCKGTALLKTCIAYRALNLYEVCETWCKKYMRFGSLHPKSYHFAQSRFQLAQLKATQKDYQSAIKYYKKALTVSNQINNNGLSADISLKIAESCLEISKNSAAADYFKNAFLLLDSSKWVTRVYQQIKGSYLVENKQYKEAEKYLLPFTDDNYYKTHHPNFKAKVAKALAEMYGGLNNFEKSNYYLKLYNTINDSIKSKQAYYKISKLEQKKVAFDNQKKEPFNLSFAFIINAFTILNLFFLALFLIIKKNNSPPNYVLAAIIFLPIFNFTHNLFILTNNNEIIPFSFVISNTVGIVIPLLVYRYTCYFVGKKFSLFSIIHILTGLSLLYLFYFDVDFLKLSSLEQNTFFQQIVKGDFPLKFVVGNVCFFGLTVFYTIMSFRLIINNYKTEMQLQTNLTLKNRYILTLISSIFLLNLIGIILFSFINPSIVELIILPILMNILFFIILLTALRSSSFFTSNQFNEFTKRKDEQLQIKKEIISINPINIDFEKISLKMDRLIANEIYLNPKLSLQQFSNEIGEPAHHISIVLKKHYKMNFFDFINSNRVKYAINFLATEKSKNMSIEGVGLSSGFNSRTSMYRAFKKFAGKTPSDFART